jgi:glycosyltransferase involved in cell wall biosynthesis
MIVKNEEAVLARCLESAKDFADEIIIVDTGSSDKTKQIAKKYTDKVYDFKWIDDFSAARNFSFSKATKDYIMWLDADDVVMKKDADAIVELKKVLCPYKIDIVTMKYDLGDNVVLSRERILKRANNYVWNDAIHEYIEIKGTIYMLDACVTHKSERKAYSDRNLKIYEKILKKGELNTRGKLYYAIELKNLELFEKAAEYYEEYLKEDTDWIEDNISACNDLALCYQSMQMPKKELATLLRAFEYEAPRAMTCCLIGYYYKNINDFIRAATWFETALNLPKRESMALTFNDYDKFVPAIELAVCLDRLGLHKQAQEYNELAGNVKADSPEYLANKEYFETCTKQ